MYEKRGECCNSGIFKTYLQKFQIKSVEMYYIKRENIYNFAPAT